MSAKFIPRRTKMKTELIKNITITDVVLILIGIVVVFLLLFSNIPYKFYITIGVASFWVMMFMPVAEGMKLYFSVVLMFKYLAYQKQYLKKFSNKSQDIKKILPYDGLSTDKFINYGEYYGMVLEVLPMEFFLLDDEKQEAVIRTMVNAIHRLNKDQKLSIVKIKKPMILDQLVNFEESKYQTLQDMTDRGLYEAKEIEARDEVFQERVSALKYLNNDEKILKNHYYFVVYDKDRETLETTVRGMMASLSSSQTPMDSRTIEGNDLLVFLKANYTSSFDERDLDILSYDDKIKWTRPDKVKFNANSTEIDDVAYRTLTITEYPLYVANAWAYPLFELDDTRIVINIEPVAKFEAEKMLDKSLMEVQLKLRKTYGEGDKISLQTHYDTLHELLSNIKTSNENLFNVNFHIVVQDDQKKEARAQLKQRGFRFTENFGRQVDAFISTSPSRLDRLKMYQRGIQSSALAAMFPFISNALQDERGFYLGYNQYPVFINFFMRSGERVNSNMVIIGKSGSGKSFCTKTLLANLAADNTRVFILDPENEYENLCWNLNGKMIDVGSSVNGIFNPFHIFTSLEADEGVVDDSYNAHLQFLEQFFRLIIPGMNSDAFERLNSLVVKLYKYKNIDRTTRLEALEPEDFPIFDDLMQVIDDEIASETDSYHQSVLQTIRVYIEKFATGGRNSNLWNGPTSVQTNENFICFNFLSLINNKNDQITNAQMLLVFKYLDNEIMKNKDFNNKYFKDPDLKEEETRRIIVTVDEAHVFINPKFPIALDFMANMAKRIRKYRGMQIIITQNIKDFVGTPDIARQSTAIINASQYSMIFALAPNDMTDLMELYKNAGGINSEEKEQIVTADRGQCFLITGAMHRTTVKVEALSTVKTLFETKARRQAE